MSARTRDFPTSLKALAALLFAGLFFVGLQAPAAHAIPPVDVTVKVTSKAGAALSGVTIYAYPVANHAAIPYATVITSQLTAKAGSYLLDDLDPGQDYALYFDAPGSATTAFDQFYGGSTYIEDAKTKSWFGDSEFTVSLATNATITGTVKNSANKPILGVPVIPWRFDGSKWYRITWASTSTNASGVYSLRNLEPGSYFIEFAADNTSGYVGELSGNKPLDVNGSSATTSAAQKIYVGLGASMTASATLATGGAISGTVDTTGFLLSDIVAIAYPYNTGTSTLDTAHYYLSNATGASGAWKVAGLPTGTYVVKLYDTFAPPEYVERWVNGTLGGAATPAAATKFAVTAPATKTAAKTRLNHLSIPGEDTRVDLTITHLGTPVDDNKTTVYIENADGDDTYYVLNPTDSAYRLGVQGPDSLGPGTFQFPFLPAGNYNVWVDPGDPNIQPYIGTQLVSATAPNPDLWTIDLPNASAFSFTTAPTVSPAATVVGTTYTVSQAVTSLEPAADVDYSYIWLRDDTPIFGATGTSYTSRGVDVGTTLSVIVRADTFGFAPIFQALSVPTPTQGAAGSPTVFPSISAPVSPVPGSVLAANVGTWDVPGLTFSYTWLRDGSPTGGTNRTYTVTPADAGHAISLVISSTAPGRPTGGAAAISSVAIGHLTSLKNTAKPVVTSTTVGQPAGSRKYTVTAGKWSLPGVSISYSWQSAGNPIGSGNFVVCTAVLCPPDEVLQVVVTADKLGYTPASATILGRVATTKPPLPTSINGEVDDFTTSSSALDQFSLVDWGHVLKVLPPTYAVPAGAGAASRSYQWQNSANGTTWTNITGQTKTTYTLPSTLIGKHVRVLVITKYANLGTYTDPLDAGIVQLKQDLVNSPQPSAYLEPANVYYDSKQYGHSFGPPYSVSGVSETLQWFACDPAVLTCSSAYPLTSDWAAVQGATSPLFVPGFGLKDFDIRFVLTASKPGYASRSTAVDPIPVNGGAAASSFMIIPPVMTGGITSGHATVGTKLTVKPGVADNDAATVTSTWQVCPSAEVCTEFSTNWVGVKSGVFSYTPTATDLTIGDTIRFNQLAHLGGSVDASTTVYPLVGLTNAQTKSSTITKVGTTYTVSNGTWKTGAGTTFTYQWYLNGVATDTTKSTTSATGPLYVDITAHKPGFADLTKRVIALRGTPTKTANPLLDTPAVFGDTLHTNAAPFTFNVPVNQAKPIYKYQWYSGASKIAGATKATYTPGPSLVGKALKLVVTMSSAYYVTTSTTTNAVTLAAHAAPSVGASISGTPRPATKLSVATTGVPGGSTLSYVWERSNDGVTGWATVSTKSTFTPGVTDVTKYLRVKVTSKKAGWLTAPATVSANAQVNYLPTITPSAPVSLSQTKSPPIGAPLTVSAAFTTTGVAVSYEWFRNGVSIPGVTGPTWTPTASSYGDDVEVHVTAAKAGYATQVFVTNTVQVSQGTAPVATSKPVISDTTPQVGQILSATTGAWNVDGLTFVYRWKLNGIDAFLGNESTYTVTTVGDVITVEVSALKSGWATGVATSLGTAPVSP